MADTTTLLVTGEIKGVIMTISVMVKNSKPKKVSVQVHLPFWHEYIS